MNEEALFIAALEKKSPGERSAFLDRACAGNGELRSAVEGLLKASADAGSFLEHPPLPLDATIVSSAASRDTASAAEWTARLSFLKPCEKPDRIGKLASKAGEYEIIEVVGHGGMGAVLRAFDTKLCRVVAVKVMAPELAANPVAVRRFLREATTAAAVHHEHVVTIHAVDDSHQPPYLVMQFVEGQTLQDKIDREGPLELKQILRIGSQAAAGLAAAHKTGLIHRDVKPSNILLENGVERVKISDFGLARAADDVQMTQTGIISGTPQYMSPEQAKGEPVDARGDLFSLGSVLYTMCTGRPAFRADNPVAVLKRVCDETPRPIHEVSPEIPSWLEAIVNKLLAKNPPDRFQSAAEVAELLSQHLAHLQNPALAPLPAPVGKPSKSEPTLPWITLHSWLLTYWEWIVGASILAVFAVALYLNTAFSTESQRVVRALLLTTLMLYLIYPLAYALTGLIRKAVVAAGLIVLGIAVLTAANVTQYLRHRKSGAGAAAVSAGGATVAQPPSAPGATAGLPSGAPPNPPLAVAPFDAEQAKAHQESWAKHLGVPVEFTNSIGMPLRLIPPGRNPSDSSAESQSKDPFFLGTCEVTVGQFRRFVEEANHQTTAEKNSLGGSRVQSKKKTERRPEYVWSHPEFAASADHPVTQVTWHDAMAFCEWLSRNEGRTYRLPTNGEWQWAVQAGCAKGFYFGEASSDADAHAWHLGNANDRTQPVRSKLPNPWGLYDVYGNVWEISYNFERNGTSIYPAGANEGPAAPDRINFWGGSINGPPEAPPIRGFGPALVPYSHLGFRVAIVGNLKTNTSESEKNQTSPPPAAPSQTRPEND